MGEAFFWGLVGGSSLLIGALLGARLPRNERVLGLMLAFGAGTLVSALTFELTRNAYRLGGGDAVTIGLGAGAIVYYIGDKLVERRGAGERMNLMGGQAAIPAAALLLGAVLDGIPESMVLGIGLLEDPQVSLPVLAAIFLSNLPEGFASGAGMSEKHGTGHIALVWTAIVAICGASAAIGYAALDGASGNLVGGIQAFAAGAVLTMLADSMFPEAFKHGGPVGGLVTTLGFALAFLLTTVE